MEPQTVNSGRRRRKALMVEHGLTMRDIAKSVPCSELTVSNVIAGKGVYDTPKTKRVKAILAAHVGVPVEDLWPEPDTAGAAA